MQTTSYTLWDLWIDTHVTGKYYDSMSCQRHRTALNMTLSIHRLGPLRRHEDNVNEVLDKYGSSSIVPCPKSFFYHVIDMEKKSRFIKMFRKFYRICVCDLGPPL